MKRYSLALFAVLALGLIGFSPSKAQAAVTCTTPTVADGAYPHNYLYTCSSVPAQDVTSAVAGLQSLPINSAGTVGAQFQLKTKTSIHLFFLFNSQADYLTYTGQTGNPVLLPYNAPLSSAEQGETYNDPNHLGNYYSVVFDDNLNTKAGKYVQNAITHEAGHQLDHIYGSLLGTTWASQDGGQFQYELTGFRTTVEQAAAVHAGDTLTLTVDNNQLVNPVPVTITVIANDTPDAITARFITAINAPTSLLKAHGIVAFPDTPTASASFTLTSVPISTYVLTTSTNSSFNFALGSTSSQDWARFINLAPASQGGTGTGTVPQCHVAQPTGTFAADQGVLTSAQGVTTFPYICNGTAGAGTALSTAFTYPSNPPNNAVVLQTTWSFFYSEDTSIVQRWGELWAEETAVMTNNIETGVPNSPDLWLQSGNFACSEYVLQTLITTDALPPVSGYQTECLAPPKNF